MDSKPRHWLESLSHPRSSVVVVVVVEVVVVVVVVGVVVVVVVGVVVITGASVASASSFLRMMEGPPIEANSTSQLGWLAQGGAGNPLKVTAGMG